MKLIENGNIVNQDWVDQIREQIIPLSNYLVDPTLSSQIQVENDSEFDELNFQINKLTLIVIKFESFTDGRVFSLAHRLRKTLGYKNKIWLSGNLISDQYPLAIQCGINGILVDEQHLQRQPIEHWREAVEDAPVTYQQPLKSNREVDQRTINYLNSKHEANTTEEVIDYVLNSNELGKIALVSSFGTESAVLLHMLSKSAPDTPVLFLDTGKLFPETLEYQELLAATLKLTNVKVIRPDAQKIIVHDSDGSLWKKETASCCEIRKVIPLQNALKGYDTWISGRKSYQSKERASLKVFEAAGKQIKVNPLASWSHEQLIDYMKRHDLPFHPLAEQGYSSVGCEPCTTPVCQGEAIRSGRWRGQNKTECGIHSNDNKVDEQMVAYHY